MSKKSSSLYVAVWTSNGVPMPDGVAREIEAAVQAVVDRSAEKSARLLMTAGRE